MDAGGDCDDRKLRRRALRVREMRRVEEPRSRELAYEQRHALLFRQRRVIGGHAGLREQLADDGLVHIGVLAQVEHGEMEAEDFDGALERVQAPLGERRGAVRGERARDRLQVGDKLRRRCIRWPVAVRRQGRNVADQDTRRRREPGIDADQRLAVGLVGAVRVIVVRRRGEPEELVGRLHEARRQRQLAAQRVDLAEIMGKGHAGLRRDRVFQRRRDDEGIAVAIAADPRSRPQERRQRETGSHPRRRELRVEARLERKVEARHLAQERVAIVGEAVVDLVLHLELREPDHRRLPQREHLPTESLLELARLVRREQDPVAPLQQPDDLALAIENALALDLGRVRGEHGAHPRVGEPRRQRRAIHALGGEAVERIGDASALRQRAGERVRAPAAILVHVLGEVREVREVAERAHHVQRLTDRQPVEQRRELGFHLRRCVRARAAEADRRLAYRFDPQEALVTRLLAQHVAQQPPEEPRVVAQRKILVRRGIGHGQRRTCDDRSDAAARL